MPWSAPQFEPLFLIGVDGGGSRCRARLCDRDGQVLGSAEAGAANVHLDFEGALTTINQVVAEAFRSAALDPAMCSEAALGLGLAGASSPNTAAAVKAALLAFGSITVEGDGVVACLGAHDGQDGGLVIAGTGSVAILRRGGRSLSIGGRGFLLGDDGSGAWLGRAAWRLALRARDELGPHSPLLDSLMAEFEDDPLRVIAWGRDAPSHACAAYAPRVFAAAAQRDAVAGGLVAEAAEAIAELVQALQRQGAPRISLVGGMAEALQPHLPTAVRDSLKPALADALDGALRLAGLATVRGLPGTTPRAHDVVL